MSAAQPASPLRIEMVLPSLERAGMETMVAGMVRALAARGHAVGVTCTMLEGDLAEELRAEGHSVAVVPAPGVWTNLRAPGLESWIRSRAPDVVHVHSGVWLKGARSARRSGVPGVVHTAHGVGDPTRRWNWMKRIAARHTDAVVAVSDALRDHLVREVGIRAAGVLTIPNAVDAEAFRPSAWRAGRLRRRLGVAEGRPLIGIVARLHPVKNHALLIDAFALLRRQLPDAVLAIVGEGELRAEIEQRIAARGLEGHVHLVGEVRDVPAVLADLDLFVLSSDSEGTSISALEAMASGRCVVATAVGGTPELLDHGRCGVLVPPRKPALLAHAMAHALTDDVLRRRLGTAARRRVEERYGVSAMIDAYERVYREVAARVRPAGG